MTWWASNAGGWFEPSLVRINYFAIPGTVKSIERRSPVATITMPAKIKSENKDADIVTTTQQKETLQRYRLQVDRQIKSSFDSLEAAEKIGKSIKKAHPVVQVSIYDSKEGDTKVIG
jgi:hypothetical protein